ncbi:Flp pilus assembly protein CpaB [Aliamphritea spongicola]|uniref:Flp pilus assembly protein CpaB n=1 Tax=Aliamphritea spongicola TaxID=707589 RepID=UPI00196B65BE|nr:Flp pilus assembly protein CpaB [Aliamphritea spongicola]MBN3564705.1 Flp pilus assembly protein CpaB [Aliamphritea spongicola]
MLTFIMLGGALLSGAIAVYLTYTYIDTEIARKEAAIDQEYKLVEVVVAKYDLKPGDVISSASVALRKVPSGFVHSDSIGKDQFGSVSGFALSYGVKAGETILFTHISNRKGGKFAALIESGTRAVTVSVDKINSAAGMLSPNDEVDLLLTTKKNDELTTLPLLSNIRVIATGVATAENLTGEVVQYSTVTLELNPENAAKVTHAQRIGEISFVLRGIEEPGEAYDGLVQVKDLLGTRKKATRQYRPVEIIIGGN